MSYKKVFLASFAFLILNVVASAPAYAIFEQDMSLPGVVVCEVESYGEDALRQEYFYTFEELLIDQLRSSKSFRVEQKLNVDPVLDNGEKVDLDYFFSIVHMDAIARGENFVQERSHMRLVRYARSIEGDLAKEGDYSVSLSLKETLKKIGELHHVKYLIFCNLKNVEVDLKKNIAFYQRDDLKGMKLKMDMDYYLVNTENGKIFEGHSFADKTAQIIDVVVLKYGKSITVQQLLHTILERQAERAVEHFAAKGINAVE